LFEKIDPSVVNQLKSRFAGKQNSQEKELAVASGLDLKQIISVEQMEEAISKQVSKAILLRVKHFQVQYNT